MNTGLNLFVDLRDVLRILMELFAKMINGFQSLTKFGKSSSLDVWQGSEYVSGSFSDVRALRTLSSHAKETNLKNVNDLSWSIPSLFSLGTAALRLKACYEIIRLIETDLRGFFWQTICYLIYCWLCDDICNGVVWNSMVWYEFHWISNYKRYDF